MYEIRKIVFFFFFKREREIKAIKLMNLSCSENAIG